MRTGALLVATAAVGCSVIGGSRPPPRDEWATTRPRYCGASIAGAVADVGGVLVAVAATAAQVDDGDGFWPISAVQGLLFAGSLAYGWQVATECEAYEAFVDANFPAAGLPPANAADGCGRDVDCKGDRICVQRVCVEPPFRPTPAP